jgi:inositol-hexakisphosphate/diphosphoinositol-pentakisphosphate 1-kinase
MSSKKWVIGVCAMDTKARSKPMRNILDRILTKGDFDAIIFGDKVILDEDIQDWPTCDFLISFFSTGFPLGKAIEYVKLRKPICLNDLPMQQLLLDRRLVLGLLDAVGVPTPQRLVTWHKDPPELTKNVVNKALKLGMNIQKFKSKISTAKMIDSETIEVDGVQLKKPFVEKPVSGEDHNIYIYYDCDNGGGVRKLFRKKGNKSSEYCPEDNTIRCDGVQSYIYEEFMVVDNAEDVKVYTIGQEYAHAETRKSPVVDGVVRRNADGKEIRYVTELTLHEQTIARRVCQTFGQTVCGFDLLRVFLDNVGKWSIICN